LSILKCRQRTEAGGEVLGEPVEIPEVGLYVSFHDPEGNRVSMLQPLETMQVHPKQKVG